METDKPKNVPVRVGVGWQKPDGKVGINLNMDLHLFMTPNKFKQKPTDPDFVIFRFLPEFDTNKDMLMFELKTITKDEYFERKKGGKDEITK